MRTQQHFSRVFVAAAIAVGSNSCAKKKENVAAPTQADRMLQTYTEIQSGRLLILADFEDEKQMALFQFESAANPGRLAHDPGNGRPETGAGALAVTFAAPSESVVISNPRAGEWALKRDWRAYDLFLMAAFAPAAGVTLETKIVGGVSGHAVEARTETPLRAGWNVLRFDLAEIGEQVPLDDIQEIRLSLADAPPQPVTLHFDDFLLAGNRRDLLGDPANQAGSLYVQSAGRHWNIGAGGRFELSFRNGQITQWFNLAVDPYRLRNLVRGTSLGPLLATVEDGKALGSPSELGSSVVARQRILEMNAIRVVVECLWEEGPAPESDDHPAYMHWVYSIYRTGQIYVSMTTSDDARRHGLAVNMAWVPSAPLIEVGGREKSVGGNDAPHPAAFAAARTDEADAAVLFIPYPDQGGAELSEFADASNRTSSMIWTYPGSADAPATRRCQLVLTSASELDSAQARARDYTSQDSIRIEIGKVQAGGGRGSDGFDPGSGSFRIQTEGNRARLVVEGKRRSVFSPVFEIDGGTNDQAWIYVNYLLHEPVIRGTKGEALFQLPGVADRQIVVEPLFKRQP